MRKSGIFLTPDQIKVITDLIDKGAEVEIVSLEAGIKMVIRKNSHDKRKGDLFEFKPGLYGFNIDLKELGKRAKRRFSKNKK